MWSCVYPGFHSAFYLLIFFSLFAFCISTAYCSASTQFAQLLILYLDIGFGQGKGQNASLYQIERGDRGLREWFCDAQDSRYPFCTHCRDRFNTSNCIFSPSHFHAYKCFQDIQLPHQPPFFVSQLFPLCTQNNHFIEEIRSSKLELCIWHAYPLPPQPIAPSLHPEHDTRRIRV